MTDSFSDGTLRFANDLQGNIAAGDAYLQWFFDECDAYAEKYGLNLPEEPEARDFGADPECLTHPILELDLEKAGVSTIIWATGFALDYGWLQVDAFDETGKPAQNRGVSQEPGVYFLGLPWQSRRGSTFLWGVWHDAKHVADQIAIQRAYNHYDGQAEIVAT